MFVYLDSLKNIWYCWWSKNYQQLIMFVYRQKLSLKDKWRGLQVKLSICLGSSRLILEIIFYYVNNNLFSCLCLPIILTVIMGILYELYVELLHEGHPICWTPSNTYIPHPHDLNMIMFICQVCRGGCGCCHTRILPNIFIYIYIY